MILRKVLEQDQRAARAGWGQMWLRCEFGSPGWAPDQVLLVFLNQTREKLIKHLLFLEMPLFRRTTVQRKTMVQTLKYQFFNGFCTKMSATGYPNWALGQDRAPVPGTRALLKARLYSENEASPQKQSGSTMKTTSFASKN